MIQFVKLRELVPERKVHFARAEQQLLYRVEAHRSVAVIHDFN